MGAVLFGCSCPKDECKDMQAVVSFASDEKIEQVVEDEVSRPRSKRTPKVNLRSATKEYHSDNFVMTKAEEGPEVTGVELKWLHWLLDQHWPYLKKAMEKVVKKDLEPIIQEALPPPLNQITFQDIDFGHEMPHFSSIRPVFDTQNDYTGLSLEMSVQWNCSGKVVMSLGAVLIGLEHISLGGVVLLKLRPLLDRLPIVGGMQITMQSPPHVQWNFTGGLALGLQMDVVRRTFRKVVADILSGMLVVPNQIFVHWLEGQAVGIDLDTLEFPEPEFVMRLCVRGVIGEDKQKGCMWCTNDQLSSAYVMLQLGARNCQMPAIRTSEEEGWFDLLVYNADQYVSVDVFCQDMAYRDVHLGAVEDLTVQKLVHRPNGTWPLTCRSESLEEPEELIVDLNATFFFLSMRTDFVPLGKGEANHQGFIFVHLRSCRGIVNDHCENARIRFISEGEEVLSKASSYQPMLDDTAIATPTQKMVEHLWETSELPEKERLKYLVDVTGLSTEEVSSIVYSRPTFTMRWGQFIAIGVRDVEAMSVSVRLELEDVEGAYAEAEMPICFDWFTESEDWAWDDLLQLKPDLATSGNRILHSDEIELHARFKLRCLSMRQH